MRLIDADALIQQMADNFRQGVFEGCDCGEYEVAENTILEAPTIDAVPVVHGWWINRTENIRGLYNYRYDCSVCQHIFWYGGIETFNYCPNCGAKMDGEQV